jgi:PAS domain S-box-containing protein
MVRAAPQKKTPWPIGSGEMVERIRTHDWAETPLGPIESWPQSLHTALDICLGSAFPSFVLWGRDLIQLYNDAALTIVRAKHPGAFGVPVRDAWSEIWETIGPLIAGVLSTGQPLLGENIPMLPERGGPREPAYFTLCYSALRDEAGGIAGVLVTAIETTEQLRTEAALRESEEHYRSLVQASNTGYSIIEMKIEPDEPLDYRFVEVNQAFETLTGLTDVKGKWVRDLIPGLEESWLETYRDVALTGQAVSFEQHVKKLENRWFSVYAFRIGAPEQHRVGILFTDVTERKGAEAANARLAAIVSSSPDAVMSFSPDGFIQSWNTAAEQLFGYSEAEALGADADLLVPPGCPEGPRGVFDWGLAGQSVQIETVRQHKDRTRIDVAISAAPMRGADDAIIGVSAIMRDIRARKRTEAALRESEARFQQFAEHSTDVLWITDLKKSHVEYVSPAYERVWGRPCDSLRDVSQWVETIHPDDRQQAIGAHERAILGEEVVLEYRILRPNGTVRRIRDTLFPIRDEHGQVLRIAGIAQDLTKDSVGRVYVVDADEASRASLSEVLRGAGYEVTTFASARAFLETAPALMPGCVVLDTRLPEAGGLLIPTELKARRTTLPVIVRSESGGGTLFAVRAMKAGAVDYLEMPCSSEVLVSAVATALADIQGAAERDRSLELAQSRLAGLSSRERQVLEGLMAGGTNRTIADAFGLSPRTIELHRSNMMEKLGVRTIGEAVLVATAAGLQPRQTSS